MLRKTMPGSTPTLLILIGFILLLSAWGSVAANLPADLESLHPGASAFVEEMVADHGMERAGVEALLANAERRQDIIDAMTRPAEAKPWHQYRPIFLTDRRVTDGVAFWRENAELLGQVEAEFGVPAEIIVAIIGVETSYGRITGRYRVIDALATLAFHYPPRAKFFRSELAHYLQLGEEEALPLGEIQGSYAGAMGLGQFISSSYRSYAVDFDDDGRRDLWQSRPDAIASVANYFKRHGWKPGGPVVSPARSESDARALKKPPIKPAYPVQQLAEWGYHIDDDVDANEPATLIELELEDSVEFWLGYHNFYVISRYNHSALYSMAVYQLSQEIREANSERSGP
jgi:membrane-bound lytic murein transglycosylase B